jgi:UDP-N-acetylmuramyl pentapeptide phosphotransferase/UDP-N-acetylglucosamine-1-phosphate transferase
MAGLALPCAAACAGLLFLLRPLLARYALARPNARSSHQIPTPQGGGIAVVGVTIAAMAIAAAAFPALRPENPYLLTAILGAAALLAVVGALDDLFTLNAAPRLAWQLVAVVCVIAVLPPDVRIIPALPWEIERGLLVVGMVWFVNLVNFMDGIDWMSVAEVVPVTAGLVLIGAMGGLPPYALAAAVALGGAMLGFAPFNRPVARLFLGDVGSLPIGLLLAWLLVLLAGRGYPTAAVLLPLYYLADATITLIRRLLNRERIWQAHRGHFYQRAVDGGLTVMQVVARVFAVNIVLAALAAVTVWMPSGAASLGTLTIGALLVAWLLVGFAKGKR